MMTVADILEKNFKWGDKLYSPLVGEIMFMEVDRDDDTILARKSDYTDICFDEYGHMYIPEPDGEFYTLSAKCALYPSKDEDWGKYRF